MKLNRLGQLHIKLKLSTALGLVLILALGFELYLAYTYIFSNLTAETEEVPPSSIVRVNLESYKDAVNFLDTERKFNPTSLNLKRSNPFKP